MNATQANLVLGFSWRTGISLSDGNPAYQMWNELRDLRITKTLGAFDAGESSRLVTQFERSINDKLLPPLRRRLQEQGQGLPWFLKKLCIHVHNQVGRGVSQVDLLGSRLNVEGLFQEDLEPLNESQLSCLHFVALNSPVDSLEVYDKFGTEVVGELVEKRLVVRAGERFAVYWDIFRDYLTDKTVPYIPFTYLPNCTLRMGISVCEVLATRGVTSHADLAHALGYRESTIVNVATDLQNLAVCGKAAGGLQLLDSLSFQKIPDRLNAQLSEHVLYQRLLQGAGDSQNLSRSEGVQLVRELYSGARVKAQTRDNYFLRIIPWLEFAGLLEISGNSLKVVPAGQRGSAFGRVPSRKWRSGVTLFLGSAPPKASLELLVRLLDNRGVSREAVAAERLRNPAQDLVALDLARWLPGDLVWNPRRSLPSGLRAAGAANKELRTALGESSVMELFDRLLRENPEAPREEVGVLLGKELGREWKRTSARRYANGLTRYREFLAGT